MLVAISSSRWPGNAWAQPSHSSRTLPRTTLVCQPDSATYGLWHSATYRSSRPSNGLKPSSCCLFIRRFPFGRSCGRTGRTVTSRKDRTGKVSRGVRDGLVVLPSNQTAQEK